MNRCAVHAELGEVIARQKPGRMSDDEIIIFDSTGTALQDVAAAAIVYEKAIATGIGVRLDLSGENVIRNDDIVKERERDIKALRSWFPFR